MKFTFKNANEKKTETSLGVQHFQDLLTNWWTLISISFLRWKNHSIIYNYFLLLQMAAQTNSSCVPPVGCYHHPGSSSLLIAHFKATCYESKKKISLTIMVLKKIPNRATNHHLQLWKHFNVHKNSFDLTVSYYVKSEEELDHANEAQIIQYKSITHKRCNYLNWVVWRNIFHGRPPFPTPTEF